MFGLMPVFVMSSSSVVLNLLIELISSSVSVSLFENM